MKYLQRLGRTFMQAVAVMPIAAILMGIGYWIDPVGWGANNAFAAILIKAAAAILDNLGLIFAVAVAFGLSRDNHGSAALAGLISFLTFTILLNSGSVAQIEGVAIDDFDKFRLAAFSAINNKNVFIGILSGIIGGHTYEHFHKVNLPNFLAFFSGRRLVPIMASVVSIAVAYVLYLVWPVVYVGLVNFGQTLLNAGPVGAGIYGFANRLLIPTGLHHAINQVFWFDLVGINDIPNFAQNVQSAITATYHPGMYQAGFFPIMMFGLPAAALAMYTEAKPNRKKYAWSLLFAAALASFTTGVTEPIEFAFMFLAPGLYFIHALLTGLSVFLAAQFGWYAGFSFSAGLIDLFFSARNPMAKGWPYLILLGLVFAVVYFVVFKFFIRKFDLQTPGREEVADEELALPDNVAQGGDLEYAKAILAALGGKGNVETHTYCATRIRLTVKDDSVVNEAAIKRAGAAGVIKPSKNAVQVIVGPHVERIYEVFKTLL